jgi:hypothetical protein
MAVTALQSVSVNIITTTTAITYQNSSAHHHHDCCYSRNTVPKLQPGATSFMSKFHTLNPKPFTQNPTPHP